MEKKFPHCGKNSPIFPHNGKYFRRFSTQWKKVFHSVENFYPRPAVRLIRGLMLRRDEPIYRQLRQELGLQRGVLLLDGGQQVVAQILFGQ